MGRIVLLEVLSVNNYNENILFLGVFIVFSIPACLVDIKRKRIPNWTVFRGAALIFVMRLFIFGDSPGRVVLEMLTGFSIFLLIRLLTGGNLGMGDVKFAVFMAVFAGFPGWFIATGLASVLGLGFALTGLISGKLNKNSKVPFAPFLTVGSIGAYLLNCYILSDFKVWI